MNVPTRRPLFNRRPESNLYRMFFWVVLILGGIWLIRQVELGNVKPLFQATPTATRTANSYALEGDAQFTAGQLSAAITAYGEAVHVDPNNAQVWAKLARIQTYSTRLLVTDDAQRTRLAEALVSINKAVELAPDDSMVHAVRAFVLDWNANPNLFDKKQADSPPCNWIIPTLWHWLFMLKFWWTNRNGLKPNRASSRRSTVTKR